MARGGFLGIELGTTAADLVAAVVDGIAHRCAELVATLEVTGEIRANGGLAKSERLLQRLADLSGLPVVASSDLEATARGAAMLAAIAPGVASEPLPAPAPGSVLTPSGDDAASAASKERFASAVAGVRRAAEGAGVDD